MPKPYPIEFREDVVHGARKREPGVTIKQIAKDFGVHSVMLQKWMSLADIDEGAKAGQTRNEGAELREARKAEPVVGAGERGPAAGCGVSVAGEPPGKML